MPRNRANSRPETANLIGSDSTPTPITAAGTADDEDRRTARRSEAEDVATPRSRARLGIGLGDRLSSRQRAKERAARADVASDSGVPAAYRARILELVAVIEEYAALSEAKRAERPALDDATPADLRDRLESARAEAGALEDDIDALKESKKPTSKSYGPADPSEQTRLLKDAKDAVEREAWFMKRCLVGVHYLASHALATALSTEQAICGEVEWDDVISLVMDWIGLRIAALEHKGKEYAEADAFLASVRASIDQAHSVVFSRAALGAPGPAVQRLRQFEAPKKDDGTLVLATYGLIRAVPLHLSQEAGGAVLGALHGWVQDELRLSKKAKGAEQGLPRAVLGILANQSAGGADRMRHQLKELSGLSGSIDKKYAAAFGHLLGIWSSGGSADPSKEMLKADALAPANMDAYRCLVLSGSNEALRVACDSLRKLAASKKPLGDAVVCSAADLAGAVAEKNLPAFMDDVLKHMDGAAPDVLGGVLSAVRRVKASALEGEKEQALFDAVALHVAHAHDSVSARATATLSHFVRFHPPQRRAALLSVVRAVNVRSEEKATLAFLVQLLKLWLRVTAPVGRGSSESTNLGEVITSVEGSVLALMCSPVPHVRSMALEALTLVSEAAQRVGSGGSRLVQRMQEAFPAVMKGFSSRLARLPFEEPELSLAKTGSYYDFLSTVSQNEGFAWCWVHAQLLQRVSQTNDGAKVVAAAREMLEAALKAMGPAEKLSFATPGGSGAGGGSGGGGSGGASGTASGLEQHLPPLFWWWQSATMVVVAVAPEDSDVAEHMLTAVPKSDRNVRFGLLAAVAMVAPARQASLATSAVMKKLRKKFVPEMAFFLTSVMENTPKKESPFRTNQDLRGLTLEVADAELSRMQARCGSVKKADVTSDEVRALYFDVNLGAGLLWQTARVLLSHELKLMPIELRNRAFLFLTELEASDEWAVVRRALEKDGHWRFVARVLPFAVAAQLRGPLMSPDEVNRSSKVMLLTLKHVHGDEAQRTAAEKGLRTMVKANREHTGLLRLCLQQAYSNDLDVAAVFFMALAKASCWSARLDHKALLEHEEEIIILCLFKLADDSHDVRRFAVQWLEVADFVFPRFRDYLLTVEAVRSPESRIQLQRQVAETVASTHARLVTKTFVSAMKRAFKLKPLHRQMQMVHFLPPIVSRMKLDPVKKNDVVLNVFMDFTRDMEGRIPTVLSDLWEPLFSRKANLTVTLDFLLRAYAANAFPLTASKAAEIERSAGKDKDKDVAASVADLPSSGTKDARALVVMVAPFMVKQRTNRITALRYLISQLTPQTWSASPEHAAAAIGMLSEMAPFCKREMMIDLYPRLSVMLHQLMLALDLPGAPGACFSLQNLLYSPKDAVKQGALGPALQIPPSRLPPGTSQWEIPEGLSDEDVQRLVQRSLLAFSVPNAESTESLQVCWSAESLRWMCTEAICKNAHHVRRSLLVYGSLQNHLTALDVVSLLSFAGEKWLAVPATGADHSVQAIEQRAFAAAVLDAWRRLVEQANNRALATLLLCARAFLTSPFVEEYVAACELLAAVMARLSSFAPGEQKSLLDTASACASSLSDGGYPGTLLRGIPHREAQNASVRALSKTASVMASSGSSDARTSAALLLGLMPWLVASYARKSTPRECTAVAETLASLASTASMQGVLESYKTTSHKSPQHLLRAVGAALADELKEANLTAFGIGALAEMTRGPGPFNLRTREIFAALSASSQGGKKKKETPEWTNVISDVLALDEVWGYAEMRLAAAASGDAATAFEPGAEFDSLHAALGPGKSSSSDSAAANATAAADSSDSIASPFVESIADRRVSRTGRRGTAAAAAITAAASEAAASSSDVISSSIKEIIRSVSKEFSIKPVDLGNAPPVTIGEADDESSEFEETQQYSE